MAEWSKASVLGTDLRAWVRTPLTSNNNNNLFGLSFLKDLRVENLGADDQKHFLSQISAFIVSTIERRHFN